MRVVCIGELVVDFIATTHGVSIEEAVHFDKCLGGSPVNLAAGLMHHGIETLLVGRVGADVFGRYVRSRLEELGLDGNAIATDREHPTRCVFMSYDDTGHRSVAIANRQSADLHIHSDQLPKDWMHTCEILHVGGVALLGEMTAETVFTMVAEAEKHKLMISFDPNIRLQRLPGRIRDRVKRLMKSVDLLKVNEEEWQVLREWGLIQDDGLLDSIAVCTCGAAGVRIYHNGVSTEITGSKVKVTDPTGAGDAFWSGFLATLLASGMKRKDIAYITKSVLVEGARQGIARAETVIQQIGGAISVL